MSESKHTPGPWTVPTAISTVVRDAQGLFVADTFKRDAGGLYEPAANALLIAAAPDLLEACKRASAILRGDGAPGWGVAKDILNTAIARAEGR